MQELDMLLMYNLVEDSLLEGKSMADYVQVEGGHFDLGILKECIQEVGTLDRGIQIGDNLMEGILLEGIHMEDILMEGILLEGIHMEGILMEGGSDALCHFVQPHLYV